MEEGGGGGKGGGGGAGRKEQKCRDAQLGSLLFSVGLQSRTVEEKHAVFEWNPKNDAFAVRDLGSVNGVGRFL